MIHDDFALVLLDEFNELNKGFYRMPDGVESKEDYDKRWERHRRKSMQQHLHDFKMFEGLCDEILVGISTDQMISLFTAWIRRHRH